MSREILFVEELTDYLIKQYHAKINYYEGYKSRLILHDKKNGYIYCSIRSSGNIHIRLMEYIFTREDAVLTYFKMKFEGVKNISVDRVDSWNLVAICQNENLDVEEAKINIEKIINVLKKAADEIGIPVGMDRSDVK